MKFIIFYLSLSIMALRSFLARCLRELEMLSSTAPSSRAQFKAKSVLSIDVGLTAFFVDRTLMKYKDKSCVNRLKLNVTMVDSL